MSTDTKVPYAEAMTIARDLVARLDSGCARWLIAGSLRRRKPEIGDIELVVIPCHEEMLDLFGEPVAGMERSALDDVLAGLGPLSFTKNGEKYKQFSWKGINVDLFIATRETWGCVATIRTGSADFSRWLVTDRRHGGAKPSGMKFEDGRLWFNGRALDTSEERMVFEALDLSWIEPEKRTEGQWRH